MNPKQAFPKQSDTFICASLYRRQRVAVLTFALTLVVTMLSFTGFQFALSPAHAQSAASFGGWNYAVIGLASAKNTTTLDVNNYNPANANHVKLLAHNPPVSTVLDGVASNGYNLLYQVPNQHGNTLYYTLKPVPGTGYFYKLADSNAGNAIWESDNLHVLIATVSNGVLEVNIQTGAATSLFPSLSSVVPTFYYQGYMYFTGGNNPSYSPAQLYRAQATTGAVQQVTSFPSIAAIYWLDPTGSTIYFANKIGPGGQSGIYSVGANGANEQLLRTYADARPVGFAADNALEFMRYVNNRFQLWKLGATAAQDTVVVKNVAPKASELCSTPVNPGITPICEANIALAPFGHALLALALNADGSRSMWSDDIATGKQFVLFTLQSSNTTAVQLPSWDRIVVK